MKNQNKEGQALIVTLQLVKLIDLMFFLKDKYQAFRKRLQVILLCASLEIH